MEHRDALIPGGYYVCPNCGAAVTDGIYITTEPITKVVSVKVTQLDDFRYAMLRAEAEEKDRFRFQKVRCMACGFVDQIGVMVNPDDRITRGEASYCPACPGGPGFELVLPCQLDADELFCKEHR